MPNMHWIVIFVLLVLGMGCNKRATSNDKQGEKGPSNTSVSQAPPEEMGGAPGITETVILGKVTERWVDTARFVGDLHPCDRYPCEAKVEIVALAQLGSDFHGQVEAGSVIDVHFDFTLEPTRSIYPELNDQLTGLKEGDYFKAALRTSSTTDHPDRYRINYYEKQR